MARIITVTSGKGGVGRTTVSANLAVGLAIQGFRTCVFDADLGLADINILFGIYPEYDLQDVAFNRMRLEDVLIHDSTGVDIIPGSFSNEKMADLASDKIEDIIKCLSKLSDAYDYIIVDSSAGISRDVVSFCMVSSDIILILTPETTSFTDSYGLLKVLQSNGYDGSIRVALNRVRRINNASMLFSKFKYTIQNILTLKIEPLGSINRDTYVLKALKQQKPYMSLYPYSLVSTYTMNMARLLAATGKYPLKPFAPIEVNIRFLNIFKQYLQCLISGWANTKKKVLQRAANIKKTPDQEVSETNGMQSSDVHFATLCKLPPADSQIITKGYEDLSDSKIEINDVSTFEPTLIPLDFETFAETRENI